MQRRPIRTRNAWGSTPFSLYWGVLALACGVFAFHGCASRENPTSAQDIMRVGKEQLGQNHQKRARELFQGLLENHPDSPYKVEAQFNIAESLYREKNYLEATFEYQKFIELYPTHPLASRAQYQIGMCSYQQMQHHDRSQKHTQDALKAFRLLRRNYPQDPLVTEAEARIHVLRGRLAEVELAVARFYYQQSAYQAAIGRLLNLLQVYPRSPRLDEALFILANSYRAEENYVKTHHVLRLLLDRFPQSRYVSQARSQLRKLPNTGVTLNADRKISGQ